MECKYCTRKCGRSGRQQNGTQRYYCRGCKKYQQKDYLYQACVGTANETIKLLVCESVGIRGIARVLRIATNTVLSGIRTIAEHIARPPILLNRPTVEVDELWTYTGSKDNECWLAYALDKSTRQVVDFVIGKRTKATLKILIDRLLASAPKKIRTDKLTIYQGLFPGPYIVMDHIALTILSERTYRFGHISSG